MRSIFKSMICYSIFRTTPLGYGHCNPHGIDTILNRRSAAAAAALTSLTAAASTNTNSIATSTHNTTSSPPNSNSASSPAVNPYFKLEDLHQAAAAAAQVAQQRGQPNTNLYWPGIQGLIANPNLWRDRFQNLNGRNPLIRTYLEVVVVSHHFHELRRLSSSGMQDKMEGL